MSIAQWRETTTVSPVCSTCGQPHPSGEPHLYNYSQEVDEDLTCHICLQPLVSPTDTKCGHTFCRACLTNYLRIQPMCPIDRQPLTSSYDCQPASLMVRRLLDKLEVECPNYSLCHAKVARCELEAHLNNRCPGAVFPCLQSCFGCTFQGNWQQLQLHNNECHFLERSNESAVGAMSKAPVLEGHISKIEMPRSTSALGMNIVGGYDSPLRCVIIQEIHPGGIIAMDGRLQAGDQLIEVNGKDLTHCPHNYIVNILKTHTPALQLSVYREHVDQSFGENRGVVAPTPVTEVFRVGLDRQPGRSLGIKLTEKRHMPGIFISEVIEGSLVSQDGRIKPDDQILEINSQDIRRLKIEAASLLIQMSSRHIEFLVSRNTAAVPQASSFFGGPPSPSQMQSCDTETVASVSPITTLDSPAQRQKTPPPLPPKILPMTPSPLGTASVEATPMQGHVRQPSRCSSERPMQPKYFTLAKGPDESLGIRVAGGLESQQGNTPVYIQNIAMQGCLGRSKLLKKGDVLLSVNGTSLLGISHSEAVAALKAAASAVSLTLGIIEGPETCTGPEIFTPTWMYWHKLPRSLHLTRTVTLHRTSSESLGFSIVGGKDSFHCNQAFHVLLVVRDSIAAKEGKLRCGDQILSVNGHRLDGLRHAEAVNLLKQTRSKVLLEILSWPGTVV